MFTPSKYQQDLFNFIINGEGNGLVNAVAGSGKSTTLIKAVDLIPTNQTVLQLAFNKSIVEDLKEKITKRAGLEIRTLHSLGCSALIAFNKCNLNPDKYIKYINHQFAVNVYKPTKELTFEETVEYKANIKQLVDLIRVNLIRSFEQANMVAEKHGLLLVDNELQIVSHAIKWGRSNSAEIDFTDMIYLPNVLKLPVPKFDWVLIDECQDLNAAQKGLFMQCLKPTSRFIAVGDPKQAIYGFAGADAHSFEAIGKIPNTKQFPLSICYRCDKAIVLAAKSIVPQIEYRENAAKGEIDYTALVEHVKSGDAILCRLTAPLTKLCMKYISTGIKAFIKGRDIGANLIAMVNKAKCTHVIDLQRVFENELNKLVAKVIKNKGCTLQEALQSNTCEYYQDKIEAIEILGEGLLTCKDLVKRIAAIFSDDNTEGICLSTVHRAKGLEYDRVFIACPDKFYNERDMKIQWQAEQEENLVYVAYTRAKHFLGFLSDFVY